MAKSTKPLERWLNIVSRPLGRYRPVFPESVGLLPRDDSRHWRGIWHMHEGRVYGRFREDDSLLRESATRTTWLLGADWCLCHSKPLSYAGTRRGDEARFPDIPDRLDLYLLLSTQFSAIAFAGRTRAAIIRRTSQTAEALEKLRVWLADDSRGKYRRARGRAQLRQRWKRSPSEMQVERQFARSALRAVGLRWPGKPNERQREWPACLREIGLSVAVTEL